MYLLDTNVISELRKASTRRASPEVVTWFEQWPPQQMYLSVITVMELEVGILRVERRDAQQGSRLRRWFMAQVVQGFEGRILPVDAAVATRCASLMVPDPVSQWDALIAATALTSDLTLVTRNVQDFQATGVRIYDPWR